MDVFEKAADERFCIDFVVFGCDVDEETSGGGKRGQAPQAGDDFGAAPGGVAGIERLADIEVLGAEVGFVHLSAKVSGSAAAVKPGGVLT
jgi:hypothetical protein